MNTKPIKVSDAVAQKIKEVDRAIEQLQTKKLEIESKKDRSIVTCMDSRASIRTSFEEAKKAVSVYKEQLEKLTDPSEREKFKSEVDQRVKLAEGLEYHVETWGLVSKIEDEIKEWKTFRETLVNFSDIAQHTIVFRSNDGRLPFHWPVCTVPIPDSCRKVIDDAGIVYNEVNKALAASEFLVVLSRNMKGDELNVAREKALARIKAINQQIENLEVAFKALVDFDFENEVLDVKNKIEGDIKENFYSLRDKILATGQISEAIANQTTHMQLAGQAAKLRASIPDNAAVTALEMAAEGVIIDSLKTLNAVLQTEMDLFVRL